MNLDFSSAKAWRTLIFALKLQLGAVLLVTPVAIFMNLRERREALPSSLWVAAPVILAITLSPWILWWLVLWLSERTLGGRRD